MLDSLITSMNSGDYTPVKLSELNMIRALISGECVAPTTPEAQPILRSTVMGLFPTMQSLQSVVDLAVSQLPITTPNAVNALLMTYHNSLLYQVDSCKS